MVGTGARDLASNGTFRDSKMPETGFIIVLVIFSKRLYLFAAFKVAHRWQQSSSSRASSYNLSTLCYYELQSRILLKPRYSTVSSIFGARQSVCKGYELVIMHQALVYNEYDLNS